MSNPFLQFGSSIQTTLWEWESTFLIEATEAVRGQQTVPRSTHQRHSSLGDKEYCLLDVLAVLVVDFLCEAIALFLTLQLGDFSKQATPSNTGVFYWAQFPLHIG